MALFRSAIAECISLVNEIWESIYFFYLRGTTLVSEINFKPSRDPMSGDCFPVPSGSIGF